jgi:hypothetical protein
MRAPVNSDGQRFVAKIKTTPQGLKPPMPLRPRCAAGVLHAAPGSVVLQQKYERI